MHQVHHAARTSSRSPCQGCVFVASDSPIHSYCALGGGAAQVLAFAFFPSKSLKVPAACYLMKSLLVCRMSVGHHLIH